MFITDQVEAYGLEKGVAEFFKERKIKYETLSALSNAPEDCPWTMHRELSPDDVVRAVFEPLEDHLPEMLTLLSEHCLAVLCLKVDGVWYLLYVVKMWGSDYYLWIGGQPADSPSLKQDAAAAGWNMPASLLEFYQVHHGFGESDLNYNLVFDKRLWNANCIRPSHRLELLSRQTEGEDGAKYQPGDMLFFLHDGGEDYFGMLRSGTEAAYYNQSERIVEDSLADEMFTLIDEYFSEMFL
ncbi:MAG TPA: hypothetical protein VJ965_05025 [Anaerolineales bacterium]|nr:hypothetical protein [Anaerolineales bacterium]